MKRFAGPTLVAVVTLVAAGALLFVDARFFAPTLAAGFAVGLAVRRWSTLLVPALLWFGFGVIGVIGWASSGAGDPLGMFGLIGLYLPVPLGVALAAGVTLGQVVRRSD